MALIRRAGEIRAARETAAGYRKVVSRVLADQAQGCGDLTVRMLSIGPEGRLPREERDHLRVFVVIQGELLFMDGDGAVHLVGQGDVVVVRPMERHHFQNDSGSPARLLAAEREG